MNTLRITPRAPLTPRQDWREFMEALAHDVRAARAALGCSQDDLAERARLSQGAISRLEAGGVLAIPLRTVFQVLTTLAAASGPIDVAVPALIRSLIAHTPAHAGEVLDPALAALLFVLHDLDPRRRAAVLDAALAIARALGEEV
jgi:transcriptional regulator with XRE-family HTH domain